MLEPWHIVGLVLLALVAISVGIVYIVRSARRR